MWQVQWDDKGNNCVPPSGKLVACNFCGRQSTCMFQDEAEFAGGSAFATAVVPWSGNGRATVLPHSSSALEPVSSAMLR